MSDWLRRLLAVPLLLAGCAGPSMPVVEAEPPDVAVPRELPQDLLLDVGVAVFDHGEPGSGDSSDDEDLLNAGVRRAERNYLPYLIRNHLQAAGEWGGVRVVSRPSDAIDVTLTGTIIHSDGESLAFRARATDARGVRWFDNEYRAAAEPGDHATGERAGDPFAKAYAALARDMAASLRGLSLDELERIRAVAEMRFARALAPDAFSKHLAPTPEGEVELRRLPAEDDPMLARVRDVRHREHAFIDTVDDYYDEFGANVQTTYDEWRRKAGRGREAQRQLETEAQAHMLLGSSRMVAGLARMVWDSPGRLGLFWVTSGLRWMQGARSRAGAIQENAEWRREVGISAEANLLPHTTGLENRTSDLQGGVEQRYAALRRILNKLYQDETGLPTTTLEASAPGVGPRSPTSGPTGEEPGEALASAERAQPGHAQSVAVEKRTPANQPPIDRRIAEADARIQTGRSKDAVDTLNRLVDEEADVGSRESARLHTLLALRHLAKDDDKQAVAAFEQAVVAACDAICPPNAPFATRPRHPPGNGNAGRRAVAVFEAVVAPAQQMIERGEHDLAIGLLSDVAQGKRLKSFDHVKSGRQLKAARKLARSRLKPADLAAINLVLARAHLAKNDYPAAIDVYERMLEPGAKVPGWYLDTSYEHLALIHFLEGNYGKSLEYQRAWLERSGWVVEACPMVCPPG